jgi:hypothetical protein
MSTLDDEWEEFLESGQLLRLAITPAIDPDAVETSVAPEPTPLHVSTQSLLFQCNGPVDLDLFWDIPVIPYSLLLSGVVRKEMKMVTTNETDEYTKVVQRCAENPQMAVDLISHTESEGRIIDARKVSQGLSRNEVLVPHGKSTKGFINCFVLNLRARVGDDFHEFHVKIFRTGQIKIPGAQCPAALNIVLGDTLALLRRSMPDIDIVPLSKTVVMTNSDFSCNYHLDQDLLNTLLIRKYRLPSRFDACSNYMGVKCYLAVNKDTLELVDTALVGPGKALNDLARVHFMAFSTGSVLVVGGCSIPVLRAVHAFLANLLKEEYHAVRARYGCSEATSAGKRRRICLKTLKKRMISVAVPPKKEKGPEEEDKVAFSNES